jgi:SAM-dependent methyltransferase
MPQPALEAVYCPICKTASEKVGDKTGTYLKRIFTLFHCSACGFYFVSNPEIDYAKVYNMDYYAGKGADPSVNYLYELSNYSQTVRNYEWQGICQVVEKILGKSKQLKWLDYGCGAGGLVRYAKESFGADAVGFDQEGITDEVRRSGLTVLSLEELNQSENKFDVVTAIEVLEHCVDPIQELSTIRRLLKPGGIFFYTTSSSKPAEKTILDWGYYVPEIHISLFQPKTMLHALNTCGFKTENPGFLDGYEGIIRFKILKGLKCTDMNAIEKMMPWNMITRLVDKNFGLSEFPIARG